MEELNNHSVINNDTCSNNELENVFNTPYTLITENAISLRDDYILHMSVNELSEFQIGVGLSNKSCAIYNLTESSLVKQAVLDVNSSVTGVKFGHENKLFYSCCIDGIVKVWDLRASSDSSILDLKGYTDDKIKPLISFDIANNDRLLCAGTELCAGDSFLLFWDLRNAKLTGGYWESHVDDIVQVAFHRTNNDLLASGSTDGLINTYNLLEDSEDDALLYTYKTDSSVEKISWYSYKGKDAISCITHTSDIHFWKTEDNDAYAIFDRNEIAKSLKQTSSDDCYISGIHETENEGELLIVSGSNENNGQNLELLKFIEGNLSFTSQLLDNKQIVRSSFYSTKSKVLVTGGEIGIISIWKPGKSKTSEKLKSKTDIHKIHKKKPY